MQARGTRDDAAAVSFTTSALFEPISTDTLGFDRTSVFIYVWTDIAMR